MPALGQICTQATADNAVAALEAAPARSQEDRILGPDTRALIEHVTLARTAMTAEHSAAAGSPLMPVPSRAPQMSRRSSPLRIAATSRSTSSPDSGRCHSLTTPRRTKPSEAGTTDVSMMPPGSTGRDT
jgi:hypothetical protein